MTRALRGQEEGGRDASVLTLSRRLDQDRSPDTAPHRPSLCLSTPPARWPFHDPRTVTEPNDPESTSTPTVYDKREEGDKSGRPVDVVESQGRQVLVPNEGTVKNPRREPGTTSLGPKWENGEGPSPTPLTWNRGVTHLPTGGGAEDHPSPWEPHTRLGPEARARSEVPGVCRHPRPPCRRNPSLFLTGVAHRPAPLGSRHIPVRDSFSGAFRPSMQPCPTNTFLAREAGALIRSNPTC